MKINLIIITFLAINFCSAQTGLELALDSIEIPANQYKFLQKKISELDHLNTDSSLVLSKLGIALATKEQDDKMVGEFTMLAGITYWYRGELDIARNKFHASQQIAQQANDQLLFARAISNIGMIYGVESKNDSALIYFQHAKRLYEKLGVKDKQKGLYNNIGTVQNNIGDYESAIANYTESLALYELDQDSAGLARVYGNIGNCYRDVNDLDRSLDAYNTSLAIAKKINHAREISLRYNNIGLVYYDQGHIKEALKLFKQSLVIKRKLKDKKGIGATLSNMCMAYTQLDSFNLAEKHCEEAIILQKELNDKRGLAISWHLLGNLNTKRQNYSKAIDLNQKALKLAEQANAKDEQRKIQEQLSYIYSEMEDYKAAYNSLLKFTRINDTILNEDVRRTVQLYENKQKESKSLLQLQDKEQRLQLAKYWNIGMGIVVFLFGMLILLFLRNLKLEKYRSDTLEKEKGMFQDDNRQLKKDIEKMRSTQKEITPKEIAEQSIILPNRAKNKVVLKDIIYLQSKGNGLRIVTIGHEDNLWVWGSLKEFKLTLPEEIFVQLNRSYIANILHIKNLQIGQVVMSNEKDIKVSLNVRDELRNKMELI